MYFGHISSCVLLWYSVTFNIVFPEFTFLSKSKAFHVTRSEGPLLLRREYPVTLKSDFQTAQISFKISILE